MCLVIPGCGPLTRSNAVPVAAEKQAIVLELPEARYWGDGDPAAFRQAMVEAFFREQALFRAAGNSGDLPQAEFLAISGGGEDGAFGAGLLVGWTATGTRPVFEAVTGIRPAPSPHLSPSWDRPTTISSSRSTPRFRARISCSRAGTWLPCSRRPGRHHAAPPNDRPLFDQAMLDAIAAEHAKGRVLLIGTTNLDARRPVIWNIGEIAASRHPKALDLVQDILVASAAIPGAFPPVMIDVEADGKSYEEMHVDGGASAQVFVYPPGFGVRHFRASKTSRVSAGSTSSATPVSIRTGRRSSGARSASLAEPSRR